MSQVPPKTPKLPPDEVVRMLAEEAEIDAEIKALRARPPEAVAKELMDAGLDLDKVHAQTIELADRVAREGAAPAGRADVATPSDRARPAPVVPLASRRRRPPVWLLVAAVTTTVGVATGASILISRWLAPAPAPAPLPPAPPPAPTPTAPPGPDIAQLREDAIEACKAGRWQACLDGLDQARDKDPAGEANARVALARGQATAALGRDGDASSAPVDMAKQGPSPVAPPRPAPPKPRPAPSSDGATGP